MAIRLQRLSPSLALALPAALLGGCSLVLHSAQPVPFGILPPASYGGTVRAQQVMTLTRQAGRQTLQCYVEITREKIYVLGATALGQRVMTVDYDSSGLHTAGPGAVLGEQIVRDLQLMTWPLAALKNALAGSRWRLDEPRPGLRQLWHDDTLASEIHYAGKNPLEGPSWLVNLDARYALDIDSRMLP